MALLVIAIFVIGISYKFFTSWWIYIALLLLMFAFHNFIDMILGNMIIMLGLVFFSDISNN